MNFAWSGSAVVGGFLIDSAGFRVTFFITAAMQTVSLVFLFALLPVVCHSLSSNFRLGLACPSRSLPLSCPEAWTGANLQWLLSWKGG